MSISHEFEFQELTPRDALGRPVIGMMLYGTAELVSNEGSDPHEFYVASVTLDGGFTLDQRTTFDAVLFAKIAGEIENPMTELGKLARAEFSEAVEAGAPEITFTQRIRADMREVA